MKIPSKYKNICKNIFTGINKEDLKEADRKRQEFSDKQAGQLQNSYNRHRKAKKATTLRVVTS